MTEVDAEPRYLIAVRPVSNNKKSCSGKTKTQKPLQLVIGTLTPTSVFLSWGILVNPKHDWTTMNNCPNDRFYTVRYREKDKKDKWILQLCPTTETVVDNLKPNTIYEFGVKDNTDDGIWNKSFIYKMVIPGKIFIPDSKAFIPVKVIKQVLQNITHRTQSEILKKSPLSGPIIVHLIVPDFNATKQKPASSPRLDIFEKPKQSVAHTETELESSKPSKSPMSEMPLDTLDLHKFLGLPKARPSLMPQVHTEPSVSKKIQPVPLELKTPVPKTIQTKSAAIAVILQENFVKGGILPPSKGMFLMNQALLHQNLKNLTTSLQKYQAGNMFLMNQALFHQKLRNLATSLQKYQTGKMILINQARFRQSIKNPTTSSLHYQTRNMFQLWMINIFLKS
ncbi:PREDICTED: target of Nesh-SH3-like [Thamnophis sirtalis]|uniref:Target of Nesh-SH3-like n=1 Tax=Thamnophis sirtalis TaxID=35019 RepID=A0A6I9YFB7_9SAUR|nr:PREDICTED: target of Nesh-SH3-like [Thamnophis sirtalis]